MDIGAIWDLIILQPIINVLITISHFLWGNFGLSVIILTVVINILMYPLTVKQMRATKATQDLQPKLAELKKKHGSNSQALAQEQMKLYKESGLSPAGCLLPMLLQMPIWIALYQSIIRVMAVNPESFVNLSRYLYSSWSVVYQALPLNNNFLWMDLAAPDMLLAVLVGGLMWVQQKMAPTQVNPDPQQKAQTQTMQVMMPLMFTFLALSFPSGLALYWAVSNLIRIVMQYFFSGWGGMSGIVRNLFDRLPFINSGVRKSPTKNRAKNPVQNTIVIDEKADRVELPDAEKQSANRLESPKGSSKTGRTHLTAKKSKKNRRK